ncbi:MAG TPA: Maf family protein [Candidatus Polarisedimenticolia bacterium]|nr:Maf family protein [Candidatus Polarisedimenticolia bacterium]
MSAVSREVILASASPRRADLLRAIGLEFTVAPSDVDETARRGEAPRPLAERLARAKVAAVPSLPSPSLAIAADTVVVVDGTLFGKPLDDEDARRMLRMLSGHTHQVITAIALRAQPEEEIACESVTSRVTFTVMSDKEIDWYIATGEGADKAGAYALQGIGALFVTSVDGSYTNVIGLPLDRIYPYLLRWHCLPQPSTRR